ncbi:MAG: ATP-binding protein [Bacteroidota bacterium]
MIKPPTNILKISSNKTELKTVETFLSDYFSHYKFSESCFNKTFLCISEAVVNSIIHGNKNKHDKIVEIEINCKTHNILINITDEGDGFNFNEVANPTSSENIMKESGRGIHIIKNIAKAVKFNDKGNSLQFQIECNE